MTAADDTEAHSPNAVDASSKRRLRLWLQLLRVTRITENHLREQMRVHHDTTLPRFDVLAALSRRPEGMKMNELSRMLLVSNGNVTGVVDRLIGDGLVSRHVPEHDRRTIQVALTAKGRKQFEILARDHEREIAARFAGIGDADAERLTAMLKGLRPQDKP